MFERTAEPRQRRSDLGQRRRPGFVVGGSGAGAVPRQLQPEGLMAAGHVERDRIAVEPQLGRAEL